MDYNVISNESVVVLVKAKGNDFIVRNVEGDSEVTVSSTSLCNEQGKYTRYILENLVLSVTSDLSAPICLLVSEEANQLIFSTVESNCTLF